MDTASTHPEPPEGEWWSDEPQMETIQHADQQMAFIATLRWWWRHRTDVLVAGNLTVYYRPVQKRSEDFRGPDVFVVFGTDPTRPRRSWVVWQEGGRYPDVILELLSDTTRRTDRGEKKTIYEQVFRTPEYFLFDPHSGELEGYRLVGGRYEPIARDVDGRRASTQLELSLDVCDLDLRLFTPDGKLVQRPDEAAASAEEHARRAEEHARDAEEHARTAEEHARTAEERARTAEEEARQAEARAQRAEAELAKLRDG